MNGKTWLVILNSPNNPSGVVLGEESIKKIAALLTERSAEYGHPIYILADEPYRDLVYDGDAVPYIPSFYPDTIYCYSFSKSLSLPGERIGYLAVPPESKDRAALRAAVSGAGRMLGYVCAPVLFQRVCAACLGQTGELREYKKNRDLICEGLAALGFSCAKPQGAFYLFVKSPEEDARAFCKKGDGARSSARAGRRFRLSGLRPPCLLRAGGAAAPLTARLCRPRRRIRLKAE